MRRTIATLFGIAAAACATAQAQVTVMAVRLGANDVVKLAKFYEAAFGLKEIDRVGNPATEIIMRYGATVAEAKAGASPEFLLLKREATAAKDPMHHAGAKVERDVMTAPIGGTPIKIAMLVDPDGNALELMELPTTLTHLPH